MEHCELHGCIRANGVQAYVNLSECVGSLILWLCGSVALWLSGSLALWLSGSVPLCLCDTLALCRLAFSMVILGVW